MGLKKTPKPKPVSEAVNASHKLKKGTDVCQRINGKKVREDLAYRRDVEKTDETQKERGRLETQGVSSNHSSVLHDCCRDGPHVAEELSGLAGVERLDLVRDPVVSLGDGERRRAMVSN